MPRRIFAAGSVTNATGAPLRLEFYPTSTSIRREADLWTIDGSNNLLERIPNGVIITDSAGAYSAFAGPDDLDTLYALPSNTTSRTTLTGSSTNVPGDAASTWATPAASTTLTGTLAAWVVTAVDCTAGAGARTLPAANAVSAGTAVSAKKADTSSNNLVVSRAGSDLIYGTGAGATSKTLSLAGEAVEFVSNGVDKWTIRSSDTPSGALANTYTQTFKPEKYGAVGDGTTNDSTAVIAAIAAAYAAGGGTVEFGPKTYRIDSQLAIPNDSHSTVPRQPPIRLVGAGAVWDGSWQGQGAVPGATILDLRSTTGPGKIDTRGLGALTIQHLTLTQAQGASDTNPFLYSTNTTLFVRDCSFYGHSTLSTSTCVQDAIVLGGTTTTIGSGSTAAFQGYGTVIERNYFARIQRGAYLRVYADSVRITNNTWSNSCGAGSGAAAIQLVGTTGFCKANAIRDNLFEIGGYVYVVRFTDSGSNTCMGNQFWDSTGSLVGVFLLEGAASASVGNRMGSQMVGVSSSLWLVDNTTGGPASYVLENQYQTITSGDYLSGKTTIVKPLLATASESTSLLQVNRSALEATNAGQTILNVKQSGSTVLGGSWATSPSLLVQNSSGQVTYDSTSVVKASGNLDLYGGSGGTDVVRIRRGVLQADTGIRHSSSGPTWTSGTGTPEGAVTAPIGSLFSRTDGGAATSLYVKESGAGNTGWVGK